MQWGVHIKVSTLTHTEGLFFVFFGRRPSSEGAPRVGTTDADYTQIGRTLQKLNWTPQKV
jgi:hypothetical protein